MDAAELEALGLYDPEAPDAADRLALLEWLADRGLSIGQIAEAGAAGRLTAVAGELALRPGPRLSMVEVAEGTDLTVEQIRQLSLTIGLPVEDVDECIYTQGDVEVFKLFSAATELFPESSLAQFVRVLGSSLARIADAAVSLFLADVETPITEAQAGELALAHAQLNAIGALNLLTDHFETVFRAHMELAIRRNTAALCRGDLEGHRVRGGRIRGSRRIHASLASIAGSRAPFDRGRLRGVGVRHRDVQPGARREADRRRGDVRRARTRGRV